METLSTIDDSVRERIKNPFVGTFILSAIALNWKAFYYILFSSSTVEFKLASVNHYSNSLTLIWMPIGIALFYAIIIPYIGTGVEYLISRAVKSKEKRAFGKRSRSIQNEINVAGDIAILNEIRTGNKRSEELQAEIENLKSALDSKEKEVLDYSERVQKLTEDREQVQSNVNKQISKAEVEKRKRTEEIKELRDKMDGFQAQKHTAENQLMVNEEERRTLRLQNTRMKKELDELNSSSLNVNSRALFAEVRNRLIEKEGVQGLLRFQRYAESKLNPSKGSSIALNQGYISLLQNLLILYKGGKNNEELTELGLKLYKYLKEEEYN